MVHGLVAVARQLLVRELLMLEVDVVGGRAGQLLAIKQDSMVDNVNERRVGWSFLEDIRNEF
jgi:hypothetical protein